MCAAPNVVTSQDGSSKSAVRRSPGDEEEAATAVSSRLLAVVVESDPKRLQAQLRSARSDLVFLQTQHRLTLRGLHAEIAKLQKTVKEMQFALFNNGITLVDEASYQAKIAQLEEDLDKWCCHCRFLSSQLEQANNALVSLNQRLQVQDWQHQAELSEKNSIIANLQRELEWKCRTLAELEMATRGRGTRRMSGPAGPLAASMTSSSSLVEPCETVRTPSQRNLMAGACGKASAASTSARKSSYRLPVIVRDRPPNDDDDDDVAPQPSQSSTTTSRSVTPRRHAGARAASAKCLPVAGASSSSSAGSSSKKKSDQAGARGAVESDRRRAQLRLPPLVDPTRALAFPARSLVHHQLTAVHCDSGLSTDEELSIDRVPSPELKPKKMGGRVVEVTTK